MTTLEEGELRFAFGAPWRAEQFDVRGSSFPPKGVLPVDFIAESDDEIVLVEIKDPSTPGAREQDRCAFVRKMQTKELTHQELAPKARTSYCFLHLMARDTKTCPVPGGDRYRAALDSAALVDEPCRPPARAAWKGDRHGVEAQLRVGLQCGPGRGLRQGTSGLFCLPCRVAQPMPIAKPFAGRRPPARRRSDAVGRPRAARGAVSATSRGRDTTVRFAAPRSEC